MTEMQQSWLIQRLTRPRVSTVFGQDNPFAFGGGRKNGGLSDEAMDVLRPIFGFDYMGAAEFEMGSVPRALQRIAQLSHYRKLSADTIDVDLSKVPPTHYNDKTKLKGFAEVYLLGAKDELDEIARRVREWAYKGLRARTLEAVRLSAALRPFQNWDTEVQGWLELDNGFFFFTDKEMWAKTAEVFGVLVEETV